MKGGAKSHNTPFSQSSVCTTMCPTSNKTHMFVRNMLVSFQFVAYPIETDGCKANRPAKALKHASSRRFLFCRQQRVITRGSRNKIDFTSILRNLVCKKRETFAEVEAQGTDKRSMRECRRFGKYRQIATRTGRYQTIGGYI